MRKRQASRFRPALDSLEVRLVLSVATASASIAEIPRPSLPVVTRGTIDMVMAKIDKAFDSYEGSNAAGVLHNVGSTIGDLASSAASLVASTILSSNNSTATADTSPADSSDSGYVTGGQGDPYALQGRLQKAINHLPFGKSQGQVLFTRLFGVGGMTPDDADLFRDTFKSMVNHEIAQGVRAGDFVVKAFEPHHPVGNS